MVKASLTVAVISDLHCHQLTAERSNRSSFLVLGDPEVPAERHPVQALTKLIKKEKLRADCVLCPGDLADSVCASGLTHAWLRLREVKTELKASLLLPTIGNHDVDSRKKYGPAPFKIPQNFHPEFPTKRKAQQDSFWSAGFFLEKHARADFLVLNTVIDHVDEATARRGTFGAERIAQLRSALKKLGDMNGEEERARIAVMHHHPMVHSIAGYDSGDVLPFGDQILEALSENGFSLIVHGHRHDPRITRFNAAGHEMAVFAAGSFSALLQELGSTTRNMFHLVSLNQRGRAFSFQMRSWEFNYGSGWNKPTLQSARFPHLIHYKNETYAVSAKDIEKALDSTKLPAIRRDSIAKLLPELDWGLPGELDQLRKELKSKHSIELLFDDEGRASVIGRVAKIK